MRKLVLWSALLVVLFTPALSAQEVPPMVEFLEVEVPLANGAAYEAAVKELFEIYRKSNFDRPIFASQNATRPGIYAFATGMNSYAELEADEELAKATAAAREKVTSASESTHSSIWLWRPDLSYQASSPRVPPAEAMFTNTAYLRPHRGQATAFEGVIKEVAELYRKHGLQDNLEVWQLDVGADGPAFAVLTGARNEADFYAQREKNQAKMSADWQAILAKTATMLREVEFEGSINRPDLSYQP